MSAVLSRVRMSYLQETMAVVMFEITRKDEDNEVGAAALKVAGELFELPRSLGCSWQEKLEPTPTSLSHFRVP